MRNNRLAILLAAPAVLAALGVVALEGWRLRNPQAELFATPHVYSLAEAIEQNDVVRAYEFIRAGQRADEPIAVRDARLTGGRHVLVPPLVWAAASNSAGSVQMLLGYGARPVGAVGGRAICVAEALGHWEVRDLLARAGAKRPPGGCPATPAGRML
jgi:hypothetical protein